MRAAHVLGGFFLVSISAWSLFSVVCAAIVELLAALT
jgi:hypothetical protein